MLLVDTVRELCEPALALHDPRKSAHIRTLVKYGMTAGQVAELYGVPVETVERLLRKS